MKIALSTDHAGLDALRQLQAFLESLGHECVNYGPTQLDPTDDYPDFIRPAAEAVARGECQMGVIMGGSGQGEAMVANRVSGVRAAVYYGPAKAMGSIDADGSVATDEFEILRLSRQHNNANILSLAARFISQEDMQAAVKLWLDTPYASTERHERRINKIDSGG